MTRIIYANEFNYDTHWLYRKDKPIMVPAIWFCVNRLKRTRLENAKKNK